MRLLLGALLAVLLLAGCGHETCSPGSFPGADGYCTPGAPLHPTPAPGDTP